MLGIAFSGGGMTAVFCTLCIANYLNQSFPEVFTDNSPAIATVSGGTIGYLLFENSVKSTPLKYPPLNTSALTFKDIYTEKSGKNEIWFANAGNYIPELPSIFEGDSHNKMYKRQLRTQTINENNWWEEGLKIMARLGYRMNPDKMYGGKRPFVAGIAMLKENVCPVSLNSSSGVYEDALNHLVSGEVDMNKGKMVTPDKFKDISISVIGGASFSSSFWAAPILESELDFLLLKGVLDNLQSKSGENYYVMDGGVIDTTGIVSHLRRKRDVIVSFYNNNDGSINDLESPIASLFGISSKTDGQNAISGAKLGQVFPSSMYKNVKRDLIDTNIDGANMMAILHDVPVLANSYLGVDSYKLKTLVIISLEFSEAFLESIPPGLDVRSNLGAEWPNKIPVGMSTMEANMLCAFSTWKLESHKHTLAKVFSSSRNLSSHI